MKRLPGCGCRCQKGVANLRAYNIETGEYLWQTIDFIPVAKSGYGTTWGYRWRETTGEQAYLSVGEGITYTSSSAAFFDPFRKFQIKNEPSHYVYRMYHADLLKVNSDGEEETVLENAVRYNTARSVFSEDPLGRWMPITVANGFQSISTFSNGAQLNSATPAGITAKGLSRKLEMTDLQRPVKNHTLRFYPYPYPPDNDSGPPQSWVFKTGAEEQSFPLTATASEVEDALGAFSFVNSVTATGGPIGTNNLDVEIEFNSISDVFEYVVQEYYGQFPSVFNTATRFFMWDMTTHKPSGIWTVPYSVATSLPGSYPPCFSPDDETMFAYGFEYPSPFSGDRECISVAVSDGSVNWNTPLFESMDFRGEPTVNTSPTYIPSIPHVSAVAYGKVAVAGPAFYASGDAEMTTHYILSESTGSIIDSGFSEFLTGTALYIAPDGEVFRRGTRKEVFMESEVGDYAEPGYVEAHGLSNGLRETDNNEVYGIGSMIVGSKAFPPATNIRYASVQLPYGTAYKDVQNFWASHQVFQGADGYHPFAHRIDIHQPLSHHTRFDTSTEWRLLHGNGLDSTTGGFIHKSTSWFSYYEPLANVAAEVEAWYGNWATSPPSPVAEINPFGPPYKGEIETPTMPTWLRIAEIYIRRGPSPLAPTSITQVAIEFRSNTASTSFSLAGRTLSEGIITWGRNIGLAGGIYGNGTAQSNFRALSTTPDDKIILYVTAKPESLPAPVPGRYV